MATLEGALTGGKKFASGQSLVNTSATFDKYQSSTKNEYYVETPPLEFVPSVVVVVHDRKVNGVNFTTMSNVNGNQITGYAGDYGTTQYVTNEKMLLSDKRVRIPVAGQQNYTCDWYAWE